MKRLRCLCNVLYLCSRVEIDEYNFEYLISSFRGDFLSLVMWNCKRMQYSSSMTVNTVWPDSVVKNCMHNYQQSILSEDKRYYREILMLQLLQIALESHDTLRNDSVYIDSVLKSRGANRWLFRTVLTRSTLREAVGCLRPMECRKAETPFRAL